MHIVRSSALALASLALAATVHAGNYATSVLNYNPGVGFATEFGTGAGFTNAVVALGEPSRVTPGTYGGPVDPFSPPYLREQVVSLGAGGSLTLGFGTPIRNRASNPYGIDFIVFGNAGYVITNGDYSGGGITDGSLFSANAGSTRVSVSPDNITWYTLNPVKAPVVDGMFPTDGIGDFSAPVNPSLKGSDFAGLDLAGIRSRYGGSGGGTGYDLAWSIDANGNSVNLLEANFLKIDVVSGRSEIDGVSIVVPEPGTWALLATGVVTLAVMRRKRGN
jgi:hypothetical protein